MVSGQSSLTKEGRSLGLAPYLSVEETLMTPQIVHRTSSSPEHVKSSKIRQDIISMIPVEVINAVKIKRTRDQHLQTEEDSDIICSKCIINA